jgi:hypothetical protein
MNEEILFVRTLDDLHRSINSNDEYEVLRASALIRQLFLDGSNSLVDRVNRKFRHKLKVRHKLEFEVVEQTPPNIPGLSFNIWAVVDGIDPRAMPPRFLRVKKRRDDFFGMIVAIIEGHEYSIRELVQFVANVMGGVHAGPLHDDKEKNLARLKELYVFSNVNLALLFIRAVGRIILESLKSLQYEVLGLSRFENKPGLSIHFALVLFPLLDKENFILDVGTEECRNRVSIFLDYKGELSLRFFDANGRRYLIHAGSADFAYRYGRPTYLSFQVAVHEAEMLLSIEAGGWRHFYISPNNSQERFKEFHFVLGSNVFGKAETNMAVMEQCVFSRVLNLDEQAKMRNYFEHKINTGYSASVRFEGSQFLYSTKHPNFPESAESNTT